MILPESATLILLILYISVFVTHFQISYIIKMEENIGENE